MVLVDLEKLATKAKGITAMSVKDVLQELVNDNLVKFDKIGIMKCVALPSSSPDLAERDAVSTGTSRRILGRIWWGGRRCSRLLWRG